MYYNPLNYQRSLEKRLCRFLLRVTGQDADEGDVTISIMPSQWEAAQTGGWQEVLQHTHTHAHTQKYTHIA